MHAINTRFNPTTNGPLHLGHLYLILVNEHEAHCRGGKFIVRFDDNQFWYRHIEPFDADSVAKSILDDLTWCGVTPDEISYQSQLQENTDTLLNKLGYNRQGVLKYAWTDIYLPEVKRGRLYPFVPDFTAEKVVQDALERITLLIRGDDLMSEFSLYNYFCSLWDLPIPRQVFLPRLECNSSSISNVAVAKGVSKTLGNFRICDYRDKGYTPEQVLAMLRHACLIDVDGPWSIENIKANPVLDIPEETVVTSYGVYGTQNTPSKPLIVSG